MQCTSFLKENRQAESCLFNIKAKNFKGNKLNLRVFVFKKSETLLDSYEIKPIYWHSQPQEGIHACYLILEDHI